MDRHNRDATVTMASEVTPKGVTVLMLVGVGLLDTQHRLAPWPPGLHSYSATTHNFWPSPSFLRFLLHGWPSQELKGELQQYGRRKEELSVLDGCVLWGARVVAPPPGREQVVARPLLLPTAHTHPAHSTPPFSSSTAATLPSALERANLGARIF